ncbi:MAG: bifunctional folylpolyglutamate synthase/dihydrofolate synthase, partial [Clostridia bacterium]|nr:bifunctional folylpolyglutamate synthase/dihydrofolate synthase [Clostridia bacterium]
RDFAEALQYMQDLTKFGFNFGLERITELLRRVGNPHQEIKAVHIGGTNGKGSVGARLGSILQAGGYRVGAFCSPHLHSYTERYRINGQNISEPEMAALITELKPHLEAMTAEGFEHPTEFEVSTAIAFCYFQRQKVDYLILEVGLGGLIDSTNVITPLLSIITNIAMDHMDYLGNTIGEIAAVKAGIIKPGIPVVTACQGEALAIMQKTAQAKGSSVYQVGKDLSWQELEWSPQTQRIQIQGLQGEYPVTIPLKGRHQQINAATAALAAEVLGFKPEVIGAGIAQVSWPARMEVMRQEPMVLIDGAHNVAGAEVLAQALQDYSEGRKIIMVFGMLGDKEREKVVKILAPLAQQIIITRPNNYRAGDWESLAEESAKYQPRVEKIEDITQAVQRALALAQPEDLICITGSLYMVAEAREYFL